MKKETGKKLIEIVCFGNFGRSTVGEARGQDHIEQRGLVDQYQIISSGTGVNKVDRGEPSIPDMKWVVDLAKNREIYSPQELNELNEALRQGDTKTVERYFARAVDIFEPEEASFRLEIPPMFGINRALKQTKDQTIVNPDTVAILAMDEKTSNAVKSIYKGSGYSPYIESLGISNAFGRGRDFYIETVRQIDEKVPLAINKVVDR